MFADKECAWLILNSKFCLETSSKRLLFKMDDGGDGDEVKMISS